MTNSLKASTKGLEIVDQARQRRGWTKTSTACWWQDAHTSRATLRRFWQGDRIQHDIFIAICQAVGISQWQQVAEPEPLSVSEDILEPSDISQNTFYDLNEAPDVERFYGRNQEFRQLTEWVLSDRCKLITVLGMGGIGKTALVLALVDQGGEWREFKYVLWRSLQTAPTLCQLLDGLLRTFSAKETVHIAHDVQTGISQLFYYVREQRCLLILDGLEAILDTDHSYRSGYKDYGDFLQRLSRDRHQSCILLTSREKLPDFADEGEKIRWLTLQGLLETDALELLQTAQFTAKEHGLKALNRLYGGNPLALKITASLIRDLFGGNVNTYLNQNTVVMGDRLRTMLNQQLDRLSRLEREIAYWLVIWQEPISLCRLQTHLLCPPDLAAILESIANLKGRSLLEKVFYTDEPLFTLPPLVMKAVSDELIERVGQEICQVIQSDDIQQFQITRSHCLLRPGTDDIAGDLILTQLRDRLWRRIGSNLPQSLSDVLSRLTEQSPFARGYAAYNLSALLKLVN
jgi:hypothetical protein